MSYTTEHIIAEAHRRGLTIEQLLDEAHSDLREQEAASVLDAIDSKDRDLNQSGWQEGEVR